jgi:capsular exopolysaccharide synthesis family protein
MMMASSGMPEMPGSEELSLDEIWRTIFKRKLAVVCFTVAAFTLAVLYTFLKTPVYESVARLQIDPTRSSAGLDDLLKEKLGSGDSSSELVTEVKILQSNGLAAQTVKALSLAKNADFAGKKFAASVTTLDPLEMTPDKRDALIGNFHAGLSVQAIPNSQMVVLSFRSRNPQLATDIVNSLIDAYMERNFQRHFESTVQVSHWLSKQTQELKTTSEQAQQKLAEFQKQHDILGTDENNNVVMDRLKQLNQQLTDAEGDRILKEARYRLAESGNPELIASVVPSTTIQVLRTQEAELRAQLAQLGSKYGSGYPRIGELQSQLKHLDGAIEAEVKNIAKRLEEDYRAASKTEAMLRSQYAEQKNQAYKLNENVAQYAILKHEVESSNVLYDTLELKLKEAGVSASLSSGYISVVDRAMVPSSPVEPRVALNLIIGLFGGLVGGLILAFVLESLDDTLRTSEDLESVVALPALGAVPVFEGADAKKDWATNTKGVSPLQSGPVSIVAPRSHSAEAFRAVCSSLLLSSIDAPPKVLVVTSALPAEGKSTISANLATAFALRGENVLLLDADMRRSSLHRQFGIDRAMKGLSTVLATGSEDEAVLSPVETIPNLKLLPAGPHPPSPAEMLASRRMAELVKSWSAKYDRIIIDTPPILPVADTLPLAARADGVVIAIRSGSSRAKAAVRVRNLLRRSNARIVGAVLNGVDMQLEYYYSYPTKYAYKSEYTNGYYESED